MIASQFILDQRLAELLQAGQDRVASSDRQSLSVVSRISAALRALVSGTTGVRPTNLVTN